MGARFSCPYNHFVALLKLIQHSGNILRIVLPIRIHENQPISFRSPCSCLNCSTITHAVGVTNNSCSQGTGQLTCTIIGAIVHDQYFRIGKNLLYSGKQYGKGGGLIFCR